MGALRSWRRLNTCLPMEVVNEFLVLLCLHTWLLLYLSNYLDINLQVVSLSSFWFSPPSHWGKRASGYAGLSCQLGLNHNRHTDIWKSSVSHQSELAGVDLEEQSKDNLRLRQFHLSL